MNKMFVALAVVATVVLVVACSPADKAGVVDSSTVAVDTVGAQ